MKFGLLYNQRTTNLGDDIQSFAIENLLPSVDYFVHREDFTNQKTKNNEPIAVVMAAWFMSRKWKWPPKENIVPLFIGFHYTNFFGYPDKYFKINYEYISGCGADYLRAYGPIGCRDYFTLEELKKRNIDAYFSGCITLTLPKMPVQKPEKEYICLVDVHKGVEEKVREQLKGTDIEIKVFAHDEAYWGENEDWKQRKAHVKERLTIYQNAKCVLTRRLHCSLPCLAMDVPVLVVTRGEKLDLTRFRPYNEWMEIVTPKQYLEGNVNFDILNPPPNSQKHLPYREAIIKTIREFTAKMQKENGPWQQYDKRPYTEEEYLKWHNECMQQTLDEWFARSKTMYAEIARLKAENRMLNQNLQKALEIEEIDHADDAQNRIKELIKKNTELTQNLLQAQKKIKYQQKYLNSRSVKLALKLRTLIKKEKENENK